MTDPEKVEEDVITDVDEKVETETDPIDDKTIGEFLKDEPKEPKEEIVEEKIEEKVETKTEEKKELTQQDKIDHAFQKKQKQLQEEKQARQAAEQKNIQIQQELDKLKKPIRPEIPNIPDVLDAQFDSKIKIREEAIKNQVIFDQQQQAQQQMQQQQQQAAQQQRIDQIKSIQKTYEERSKEFGIDEKDGMLHEKVITPFITAQNAPVAEYLLNHEKGPLIVKYLSENPFEIEKLSQMSNMNAAIFINDLSVSKVKGLKTTKTVAPGHDINGKGAPTPKHELLEGATFS